MGKKKWSFYGSQYGPCICFDWLSKTKEKYRRVIFRILTTETPQNQSKEFSELRHEFNVRSFCRDWGEIWAEGYNNFLIKFTVNRLSLSLVQWERTFTFGSIGLYC